MYSQIALLSSMTRMRLFLEAVEAFMVQSFHRAGGGGWLPEAGKPGPEQARSRLEGAQAPLQPRLRHKSVWRQPPGVVRPWTVDVSDSSFPSCDNFVSADAGGDFSGNDRAERKFKNEECRGAESSLLALPSEPYTQWMLHRWQIRASLSIWQKQTARSGLRGQDLPMQPGRCHIAGLGRVRPGGENLGGWAG
jgi:hypothetical protein